MTTFQRQKDKVMKGKQIHTENMCKEDVNRHLDVIIFY